MTRGVDGSGSGTAVAFRLVRLGLRSFRSYADLSLRLDGRHVCLFGANGAGKTNLIEAVSLLGPGRGLRGAALGDLVRTAGGEPAAPGWAISAGVDHDGSDRTLQVGLDVDEAGRSRRVARIDGAPASQGDLAELVRIVWLTPAMDRVFAGGAGDRRRFYDRQVLAHWPAHGAASAAYETAMRDRNALLERHRPDPAWLDAIEARMAEAGARIARHRVAALRRLQAAIDQRPDGAFPKADLTLEGEVEALAAASDDDAHVGAEFARRLKLGRSRDAAAGRTLTGVHRSDLRVVHRPKSAPADQCSTGEQKALLVGLILANAHALIGRDFAPNPLVLLDEAAAHLDSDRRAALYDELSALGGQAWLTGADRSLFEAFGDRAQRFEVSAGTAREA